ncbi:MAG: holo-ACP synthase [Candidatus Babeliales bacterium]
MITGIGIDSVDIEKFAQWHSFEEKSLLKIFSPEEIAYCLENPIKSAERFAVRFAAKEAFYKAFCASFPEQELPLVSVIKHSALCKQKNGHNKLCIAWDLFYPAGNDLTTFISLTHTKTTATAFVILEKRALQV